ncbi:MAG TPA: cation:proton antiporter [Acidimicrobiia bacterium]|nr:cation:proton antiporter [Acidimicrobiia bacterium]
MDHTALLFLELGSVIVVLAVMARVALRFGLSPIPFYLLGGLAFGIGGVIPLVTSEEFINTGAEIGVILLLVMLGLEYSADELLGGMRTSAKAGLLDLALNFTPGYAGGLLLGFGAIGSLFMGGVTYISSSGVVAKLLGDLGWTANRETPVVLSILVFEDLAMAVFLPILGAVAVGGTILAATSSIVAALAAVATILIVASRHGDRLSRMALSSSDEVNLLTVLGITLLVAGAAEQIHVSAAVGAFLVGIGVSGEAAHRARGLLSPLRDLFAAVFFVFFGLSIDPRRLPSVALVILALAAITTATKLASGWWAARDAGIGPRGRRRAGAALVARGEFSIVIAGLGVSAGVSDDLGAIAAGYILVMATTGPILARVVGRSSVP